MHCFWLVTIHKYTEVSFQTTIMHLDIAKVSVKYASYDKKHCEICTISNRLYSFNYRGQVTIYSHVLGQRFLKERLVAWWSQAITWTNVDLSLSFLLKAFASYSCWAHFLPHRKSNETDILSHSPVTTNQNDNQGRIAQFVISMFKFFVHSCVTVFTSVTFPFTGRCPCTRAMCNTRAPYCHLHAFVGMRLISMGAVAGTISARCYPVLNRCGPHAPGNSKTYLVYICGLFAWVMPPCRQRSQCELICPGDAPMPGPRVDVRVWTYSPGWCPRADNVKNVNLFARVPCE